MSDSLDGGVAWVFLKLEYVLIVLIPILRDHYKNLSFIKREKKQWKPV